MRLFPPISFVMFFKHLNRFMYIFSPLYTGRSYILGKTINTRNCVHIKSIPFPASLFLRITMLFGYTISSKNGISKCWILCRGVGWGWLRGLEGGAWLLKRLLLSEASEIMRFRFVCFVLERTL